MKLTSEDIDIGSLVLSEEQLAPRTPGIHVSTIIRHMVKVSGLRDNTGPFTQADLDKFAIIGRLWEAQLAAAAFLPPRHIRPGEVECDGIIGSPDSVDTESWSVDEFKVSWKSAKRDIHEFVDYWWQIKSYCYMLDICDARLHILHVCGNYGPPVPVIRRHTASFAQAELRQNWLMMKENAKALQCSRGLGTQ